MLRKRQLEVEKFTKQIKTEGEKSAPFHNKRRAPYDFASLFSFFLKCNVFPFNPRFCDLTWDHICVYLLGSIDS